jgi:hypothetical protein
MVIVIVVMFAVAVFFVFVFVAAFIGITRPVACLVVMSVVRRDPGVAGFLCDTFANACSRRTASASAQYRTGSPAHRLPDGGTGSAAHGAPNDRATLTRAGGADGGTGSTTDGPANDGTVASPHRLTEYRTCGRTYTPAKEGSDVIRVCRVHQSEQGRRSDQGPQQRERVRGSVKCLHVRGVGLMPAPLNVTAYVPLTAHGGAG